MKNKVENRRSRFDRQTLQVGICRADVNDTWRYPFKTGKVIGIKVKKIENRSEIQDQLPKHNQPINNC